MQQEIPICRSVCRFCTRPCLSLWERCPQGGEGKVHHRQPYKFRYNESIAKGRFLRIGALPCWDLYTLNGSKSRILSFLLTFLKYYGI